MIRAESRPATHLLLIGQRGAALVELLAELAATARPDRFRNDREHGLSGHPGV